MITANAEQTLTAMTAMLCTKPPLHAIIMILKDHHATQNIPSVIPNTLHVILNTLHVILNELPVILNEVKDLVTTDGSISPCS